MAEDKGAHQPEIDALHVEIGRGVQFGAGVQIKGIGHPAQRVVIGDHVRIGDNVRLLVDSVEVGDYTTIHQNVTANGYDALRIGSCCWIGQNAFLNASNPLSLDDGCIFGSYSSVWTHLSGPDPLAGFRFFANKPARLGIDSYVAPQCCIAPVTVGARAMLLGGCVLTKDAPENTVWGGNPAQDLTGKLGAPFTEVGVEGKFQTLCKILRDFAAGRPRDLAAFLPIASADQETVGDSVSLQGITVVKGDYLEDGASSVFDTRNRTYSKLGTDNEIAFMRYLLPHVKFYPRSSAG